MKRNKRLCIDIDNKESDLFHLIMTDQMDQLTWVQTMEALMEVDPRAKTIKSQIKLYKSWRKKHLQFAYEELNRARRANECLQMLRETKDRGNKNG